jgi:hypothetical protein
MDNGIKVSYQYWTEDPCNIELVIDLAERMQPIG